jgi:hypothetical protein
VKFIDTRGCKNSTARTRFAQSTSAIGAMRTARGRAKPGPQHTSDRVSQLGAVRVARISHLASSLHSNSTTRRAARALSHAPSDPRLFTVWSLS